MERYKLSAHPYAQCGRYFDNYLAGKNGWMTEWGFFSYDTKVIIIRGARVVFTGSYSPTTSRQMTWWLNEYACRIKGLTKHTLKLMNEKGLAYNSSTGELEPLESYELREIKEIRRAANNYGYGW
jgi:hypothetical protein